MSVVYPDNDLRQQRASELLSQSRTFITDAAESWERSTKLLNDANRIIESTYRARGLPLPKKLEASVNINDFRETLSFWESLGLGLTGAAATDYFAPAVTRALVGGGAMSREFAEKAIFSTLPSLGSKGGLVGGFIAGVLVTGALIAIDVVISAIAGAVYKTRLLKAIRTLLPVRLECWVVKERCTAFETTLQAQIDALQLMEQAGADVDSIMRQVSNEGQRLQQRLEAIDRHAAVRALIMRDHYEDQYVAEDVPTTTDPGRFFLRKQLFALDLWDSKHDDAAPVRVAESHGGANQLWKMEYVDEHKAFVIRSQESGKYLAVHGASMEDGADIVQWDYNTGKNQLWTLAYFTGATNDQHFDQFHDELYLYKFIIVSRATGFILEPESRPPQRGDAVVQRRAATAGESVIWEFKY